MKRILFYIFIFCILILSSSIFVACESTLTRNIKSNENYQANNSDYCSYIASSFEDVSTLGEEKEFVDLHKTSLNDGIFIGSGAGLDGGGDELAWYYSTFGFWFYNIPGYFIDIVGSEPFHQWTLEFGHSHYGFREWREANLRTFIKDFNLTAQDLIIAQTTQFGKSVDELEYLIHWGRYGVHVDVNKAAEAQLWAMSFSLSDIEALFSSDNNVIWAAFPGQGVIYGGNVYSPEWLLSNIERSIYGELIPLIEIERVIDRANFHPSLREVNDTAKTTLQTAQHALTNPTPQQLSFNLNSDPTITPFSASPVPATIPPITLNTWDAIMDSLELGHLGIPIGNPTRTGYHFMGWYLDADFTVAITEVFRMPARNATLYARWEIH